MQPLLLLRVAEGAFEQPFGRLDGLGRRDAAAAAP